MIYEREKIKMKYNLKIIWNENDLKSECSVPIQAIPDKPDNLNSLPQVFTLSCKSLGNFLASKLIQTLNTEFSKLNKIQHNFFIKI